MELMSCVELVAVVCNLNDKCVIHIPEPYPWRVGGSVDSLNFKLFNKQVGHNGVDR